MPPSARGDVVPKDDKGEYTIQGKLIYRSLEMYYVLERFAKMCGRKVRRCDILSRPNELRGWKPHLRKPPAKWLQ